ncbi:MAG TPA: glycosyltransferase family 2 protein [Solirubrobacteraceae bacterium]|nr:glycosyltransferase family 2 protein [Solirubrobacteraceae bacterium]
MAAPDRRPFFSVLITAFNRQDQIERCVRSCVDQTFDDFEIVVVDDGSTDATSEELAAIVEPRLRVVSHDRNRGISPARATAVAHSRGEWLVMVDSDWELFAQSLARLRALIDELPPNVRIIRSRLQWDDGSLSPAVMPAEPVTDYRGRLRWLETVAAHGGSSDAGLCVRRSVFETTSYFSDRRGAVEPLWELDLARREPSLWVPDVLGAQHVDAVNSHTRDASARLIPRLLEEAPDVRWMAATMLSEHGTELARYAPRYRGWLLNSAALESFLAGDRRGGVRYARSAARVGAGDPKLAATVALGLLGPGVLARSKVAGRRWRASRAARLLMRSDGS